MAEESLASGSRPAAGTGTGFGFGFDVHLTVSEDNIICKRASGRSIPVVNDDLREREEQLGLWDGSSKATTGQGQG